ncbi:fumarylacetoacetate hydrolase family protein [Halobacillus shinanisalinarum]|uniref:Fumarylacetoacetate hydrolase family protein n=1 Tax=Halobacillus shinanisalinarum TaxID=2932258 RepID=A0ABY4GVY9_9BACI|nr:fumarylacetoacetate hydrolase family protein [Halobacillus shinanisalinarum]UOQ92070.1 fumarylacetoacetate hydrolase family protein [Halobacillus shinanisalinarum]
MHKVKAKLGDRWQMEELGVSLKGSSVQLNEEDMDGGENTWNAPVSGTIYGTLLNYKGALKKMGEALHNDPYKAPPKAPIMYIKPQNTVIGHQASIPLPDDMEELEVGACLGIVMGKKAARVKAEQAFDYIEGYTVVNDISVPHESVFRPAVKHKARDGFCPIGPWIIEKNAVPNPDQLGIQVYINGEWKQSNNTENLVRSVSRLLADVTEFMTLEKGDTLLVGVPEDPPLAKDGDHIRIEIDQVGVLENVVSKNKAFGRNES